MPVPSTFADLTPIASTNSPQGTESVKGTIDDYFRAAFAFIAQLYSQTLGPSVTLASAATVNIGFAQAININITGTATITAFDTVAEGTLRWVVFGGALTLKYNATIMQLPGAADIQTAAGDVALFKSVGGGNWKCLAYQRISGAGIIPELPLSGGTMSGALVFNNAQPIRFIDKDGTSRLFAFLDPSNLTTLVVAGGTRLRIVSQDGATELWNCDNAGNTNQAGSLTVDTSTKNVTSALLKNTNSGNVLALQGNGSNPAKTIRVVNSNIEVLNSAYNAVIMSVTDAGVLSAPVVTQTSDERKKKRWQRLPGDFIDKLARIRKAGTFLWKKGGEASVGIGAQSLEAILPEAVYTDDQGGKTVNTGGAAIAILAEVARELVQVRARLAKLEAR